MVGWCDGAGLTSSIGASYNLDTVGQGPTALEVGAGGGCLDIFTLIYPFSPLSPSLWETARYRLEYCLKGPLNQKQPTNQPLFIQSFLEDRTMQVRVGSALSDLYDQEEGVPQGSILSTTFFSIKINNIVNCLDNKTDGSLYVDDFGICCRSKRGWSGGAMVLGKLPVPGRPTI